MPPPPTALHCSSPPPSGGGPRYAGANERGAALVISLVLLAVMTLFGISMVNTTLLEERMASNQRDTDIAFQATEAALRDAVGELRLGQLAVVLTVGGTLVTEGIHRLNAVVPDDARAAHRGDGGDVGPVPADPPAAGVRHVPCRVHVARVLYP